MWNETHLELLRQIVFGTNELKQIQNTLSLSAHIVLQRNSDSLYFKELIDLTSLDASNLSSVHNACKFLLKEFGQDLDRCQHETSHLSNH